MDSESSAICSANDCYYLDMCEWTNCSTSEELKFCLITLISLSPCPKIMTSSSSSSSTSHQSLLPSECTDCFQFKSEEELLNISKGYTPANTNKSTKWTLKVWSQARKQRYPEDLIPEHLQSSYAPVLNTHLARFAVETRKANGEPLLSTNYYVDFSDT